MATCDHCDNVDLTLPAAVHVCEGCVTSGDTWVQLRVCKTCGYVGCCDSSANQHARGHYHTAEHPIMGPADGGGWLWCYPDDSYIDNDGNLV
ncbi:MAG: UBP-type zinc finger domain-containing protein [Actinomycetota bacterium]|nr:UBP-type zinc finger domain-containing protein [Actinomycetota bacterium]